MKLSPGRFSFIRASYTVSWTAIFREGMHMNMHMFYLRDRLLARLRGPHALRTPKTAKDLLLRVTFNHPREGPSNLGGFHGGLGSLAAGAGNRRKKR